MSKPLVIANWKMHKDISQAREWVRQLSGHPATQKCEIVLCPPAIWIPTLGELCAKDHRIALGGQDCHASREGAHTGDISAFMLKEAGCTFVIIGHSERRRDYGENNDRIRSKLMMALQADLTPILCVGENVEERADGRTENVLHDQLSVALDIGGSSIVIAYEPVWAIGVGRPAADDEIGQAHRFIRATLKKDTRKKDTRVIYGGSVAPSSVMFNHEQVDGVLVGSASLHASQFLTIIEKMGR